MVKIQFLYIVATNNKNCYQKEGECHVVTHSHKCGHISPSARVLHNDEMKVKQDGHRGAVEKSDSADADVHQFGYKGMGLHAFISSPSCHPILLYTHSFFPSQELFTSVFIYPFVTKLPQ